MGKHQYSSREIHVMKADVNRKIKQIKDVLIVLGEVTPLSVEKRLLDLEFKALEYKAVLFTRVKAM